jgi:hypothetical protein
MSQHQLIGLGILALAAVDAAIGHLLVVPRVNDARKRLILRVSFTIAGLGIAAVGFAVYSGALPLG